MPYSSVSELPTAVKALPASGQAIFKAAFNNIFKEHKGDEKRAFAGAWSAVEKKYTKKSGKWVLKQEESDMKTFSNEIRHVWDAFRAWCPQTTNVSGLAKAERILQNAGENIDEDVLKEIDYVFTPVFTPTLSQYSDEYPGSFSSTMDHIRRAYNESVGGSYRGGWITAFYPDRLLVCRYGDTYMDEGRKYFLVPYEFDPETKETEFDDPIEVDVMTIVVPKGGKPGDDVTLPAESDAEEAAETAAGQSAEQAGETTTAPKKKTPVMPTKPKKNKTGAVDVKPTPTTDNSDMDTKPGSRRRSETYQADRIGAPGLKEFGGGTAATVYSGSPNSDLTKIGSDLEEIPSSKTGTRAGSEGLDDVDSVAQRYESAGPGGENDANTRTSGDPNGIVSDLKTIQKPADRSGQFTALYPNADGFEPGAGRGMGGQYRGTGDAPSQSQQEQADSKTDGGQKFSKSAYLIVPDAKKPSTWKVRIEETPGKVTVPQLGRAYASLTKGFRGNKVEADSGQISSALRRLRGLYKKHGGDWPGSKKNAEAFGEEIPEWLLLCKEPPGGKEILVQTQNVLLQVTGKDEKTGVMNVEGTATVANVINSKNQVYPIEVWQDNLPSLQRLSQEGRLLGECDHPSDGRPTLEKSCLKYTEIWQDGNEIKFTADVLPTDPHGKNMQVLIAAGVPVDISSRGLGTTCKGEFNGVKDVDIVQRGFLCKSFDAVVAGASPGSTISTWEIAQSDDAADQEDEIVGEISDKILKQLDDQAARQDKIEALLSKALGGNIEVAPNAPPAGDPATQTQDGKTEGATVTAVLGGGQQVNYNQETLIQMNGFLVQNRIDQLYTDARAKIGVQWANVYRKHLANLEAKTTREIDQQEPRIMAMLQDMISVAPQFPSNGFQVQPDVGERGFKTGRELIEKLVSDLPDETSDDPLAKMGLEGMQQNGITDSVRTPRRQLRRWLTNIAQAHVGSFDGAAALRGLVLLTQGYGAQQVRDQLDQAIQPGDTTVSNGGAPSSNVFIFPLIRRLWPMLIANELASVQPMDRPDGKIFFLDAYRVEPGASETDAGGLVSSSRVRIDRTDSLSSSYANDPGETNLSNKIQLHLASKAVSAQTKKLHALWTIEELQDLRAYHGLDAAAELVSMLARELAMEWNQIVLNELVANAATNTSFGTVAPSSFTQTEWDRYIARFIFQASNNIFKKRRGDMTHIIAGADAWLRLVGVFNLAQRNIDTGEAFSGLSLTPFTDGPFAGLRTFKTSFWDYVNTNTILVVRRGPDWNDVPYVWAPYIDYVSPVLTTPDVFTQKQGMMSRAAHSVVSSEAIATVTVQPSVVGVPL